jgi:predicted transposase/invertase (TIGR01784 family)
MTPRRAGLSPKRAEIARSGARMTESRLDAYGYNSRNELTNAVKNAALNEYAYQYDDIGNRVRFDVFARDSKGKEYDIEIQRENDGADPKRARYNSALMDANALKTGEDVAKLRDTYVIFITENDVIGGDKEIYQIDRMIRDLKCQAFGDGAHIIYVNGATRSASDIGRLVHDLLCSDAAKMYFDVLRKQVSQFKNSEEGRRTMCEAVERIAERRAAESRAEGERKGKRETMLATAKRLLANGKLMLKEIAECSGLSLAQVKKLQASMA